jgi:hypothetical protein
MPRPRGGLYASPTGRILRRLWEAAYNSISESSRQRSRKGSTSSRRSRPRATMRAVRASTILYGPNPDQCVLPGGTDQIWSPRSRARRRMVRIVGTGSIIHFAVGRGSRAHEGRRRSDALPNHREYDQALPVLRSADPTAHLHNVGLRRPPDRPFDDRPSGCGGRSRGTASMAAPALGPPVMVIGGTDISSHSASRMRPSCVPGRLTGWRTVEP